MGQLKPGVSYTYERDGGVVYSKEAGSSERTPIGWDYRKSYSNKILEEAKMWLEIRRLATTNVALHNALENAITIYNLIKDDNPDS